VLIRVIRGLLSSICGLAFNHLRSRSQLTTHYSQLAGTATGPAGKKAPPFPAGLVFSQPVGLSLEDAAQLTADFPQPATDDLYILH
jgi:hypothetical protein